VSINLLTKTNQIKKNELVETGNFGGGTGWFSGQVKNLSPVTPVNSFEIDVMGVPPIDNSQIDNS
jgi:hypothetical protein